MLEEKMLNPDIQIQHTSIIDMLKPQLFGDHFNMLKYIVQHNNLSEHFKSLGEYELNMCMFKAKYFDNTGKKYRAQVSVNDLKEIKPNVELDIFKHISQVHLLKEKKIRKN